MEENRVPVYGKDSEGKSKRGFDWLRINGKTYLESINREGHKVKTPVETALAALQQLQQQAG